MCGLVTFNLHTKIFTTTIYIKTIHSRCITPWDSHGSISSKRAIVDGEVKRAVKCSTDSVSQKQSLNLITELFVANRYPKSFIKSVVRSTLHNNRRQNDDQQQFVYLKLPFINEELSTKRENTFREWPTLVESFWPTQSKTKLSQ